MRSVEKAVRVKHDNPFVKSQCVSSVISTCHLLADALLNGMADLQEDSVIVIVPLLIRSTLVTSEWVLTGVSFEENGPLVAVICLLVECDLRLTNCWLGSQCLAVVRCGRS